MKEYTGRLQTVTSKRLKSGSVGAIARVLVLLALSACEKNGARNEVPISTQDSLSVAHELSASLAGDVSPGGQNYSYRGLYAGMTREHVESSLRASPERCAPVEKPASLDCHYEVTLGPDSARVTVDASYSRVGGDTLAHVITIERPLPLDVDGIALARQLGDAFERQTRLLDKRDATFEGKSATLHIGTMSGDRQNYVDIVVAPRSGREVMTVKLQRAGRGK